MGYVNSNSLPQKPVPADWCVCWNNDHCTSGGIYNKGDWGCLVAQEDCHASACAFPRICFCDVKHPISTNPTRYSCEPVSTNRTMCTGQIYLLLNKFTFYSFLFLL